MKNKYSRKEFIRNSFAFTALPFMYSNSPQGFDGGKLKSRLPLKTGIDYLDIFRADGDEIITRPKDLGIVNSMATVGIPHDYVGVLEGLWAIPLVSSDFYIEPRFWGEKVKTEHYTWLPFQTSRVGRLKGLEVKSTTSLLYKIRAGLLSLNLKNVTNGNKEVPLQFIANDPFTYRITLNKEKEWGFGTPHSKTAVENVVDRNKLLRVQGEYAIALGGNLEDMWWEEPTRRFHGKVILKPNEEITISLAFSIENKKKAKRQREAILATPSKHIEEATKNYIAQVENIFSKVPRFYSDNKALEKNYSRSLSIFITNKFNVPEFVFNPYYGTGAVKGGCTKNYLWNFGQVFKILTMLDPESVKTNIKQFIRSGCLYNGHSFYPLTGKGSGSWYMVNQEKIIRLVYYYVKLTGDAEFLNEKVKDNKTRKTILNVMIENAMLLDDKAKPVELLDYGVDNGAANSHLELRREYRYNHVMPDLNGRRYDNYKRVFELCELAGQPEPYLMKRAESLKKLLKKELWNSDINWFNFIDSKGDKAVRYTAQMFMLLDSNVIDKEIEQGLLSHLNEKEFLSDYGLHSMSKKDKAYDQVDIDNGGGGNCTSFTPLIIEYLYKNNKPKMADNILKRILWWGTRMPYFSDSEPANEIDYRQDTPLQSNISTGTLAQAILFGMFGIGLDFNGTITINPVNTDLTDKFRIGGLKIRSKTIDVTVEAKKYTVKVDGRKYVKAIGTPTQITI